MQKRIGSVSADGNTYSIMALAPIRMLSMCINGEHILHHSITEMYVYMTHSTLSMTTILGLILIE